MNFLHLRFQKRRGEKVARFYLLAGGGKPREKIDVHLGGNLRRSLGLRQRKKPYIGKGKGKPVRFRAEREEKPLSRECRRGGS